MNMNFQTDDLASPEYRDQLKLRYEEPGWGGSGHHHCMTVATFARGLGATSVLDYGCGRGRLKESLLTQSHLTDVREYDPGIIGKDALPDPADLVVATDVLEHIEPEKLSTVLRHIRSLAIKGCYFIIATSKSKETLADGRNAHLIQKPGMWWTAVLRNHDLRPFDVKLMKGVHVWVSLSSTRGPEQASRVMRSRS